jgi:hypothetical protein
MPDITERYITITRDAKQAIKERGTTQRSSEENRVYDAFRRHARDAYSTLKPANSRG